MSNQPEMPEPEDEIALPRSGRRVYGGSPSQRRFMFVLAATCMSMPAIFLFFFVKALVNGDGQGVDNAIIPGAIIGVITLPLAWVLLRYPKLVLSEAGIEVQQFMLSMTTTWDNVAMRAPGKQLGLVTREPMASSGASWQAAFSSSEVYEDAARGLIAARRYLALDNFVHWLMRGDLGTELARWAPWLAPELEAYVVERKSRPSFWRELFTGSDGQPIPAKNILVVVALVALAIGLAAAGEAVLGPALEKVFAAVFGLGLALAALSSIKAAVRCFGQQQYGPGLLFGGTALVTLPMVLLCISPLLE